MDVFEVLAGGDLTLLREALAADPALAASRHPVGDSLLAWAAYSRNPEAIALLRAALPEISPHEAVILDERDAVHSAIESAWDANTLAPDGFTPLALAAFFAHEALFDLLLPLTADLDRRAENPQQVAALHAATAARSATMVEKLLRAGANPELPQAGGSLPLHAAARNGDAAITALLLLFGASPARTGDDGKSAIDYARDGGHGWLADRLAAAAAPPR